jgi:hypothetical protein
MDVCFNLIYMFVWLVSIFNFSFNVHVGGRQFFWNQWHSSYKSRAKHIPESRSTRTWGWICWIRSLSGVAETWWDAGGIFACPDTNLFSARCQNQEEHSPLAIHTAAFLHSLVLLAAGLALCYGESINFTWVIHRTPFGFFKIAVPDPWSSFSVALYNELTGILTELHQNCARGLGGAKIS